MAEAPPLPPIRAMRHGETEWNPAGRLRGHDVPPLTGKGRAQAREAGARPLFGPARFDPAPGVDGLAQS